MKNALSTLSLGILLSLGVQVADLSVANADVLTVRAEARGGAAFGKGMFGARKADAFQDKRGAGSYGVIAGVELFFVDLWVQHDQFLSGGTVSGTWTQFMAGFDVEINFDDEALPGAEGADEGPKGGTWFTELGLGVGFGVGTGQQVDPPLDNSEVTDKGFLLETRAMVGYRLTSILSLGMSVPVQFGYFTKAGQGAVANNVDNHYSAVGGAAMLTVRGSWNIK